MEVSSITGRVNIGGIDQPIFGQRVIEHEIRLREGEVNILGGIIEQTEITTLEGWPGLARIPFLRYLFSSERKESQENELLIVLTPRILRLPEITAANLRPLAVGTDETVALPRPAEAPTPPTVPPSAPPEPQPQPPSPPEVQGPASIRFEPAPARVSPGQSVAVDVVVENVRDLFSVPFVLSFDPAVVELAEVHHGGLLGGEQPAALVHRVDKESGTAIISLSRAPGASGVTGRGTLVTLVFRGLVAARTQLVIQQIAARDSQRRPLGLETAGGEVVVE